MGRLLAFTGETTFDLGRAGESKHCGSKVRHPKSPRVKSTHLAAGAPALPPDGVSETLLPPMAPALKNALHAATGKCISLPPGNPLATT